MTKGNLKHDFYHILFKTPFKRAHQVLEHIEF